MCPRTKEEGDRAKAWLEATLRPREDTEPKKDTVKGKRERAVRKKSEERTKTIKRE